ncbi:MAG: O-antigen ligase family protein [Bacillota bacterium]
MRDNRLKNGVAMTLILCSVIAIMLYGPSLKRGMFFREDYLPYLKMVAWLFALVSLIAVFRGDKLWHGDIDVLLVLIVALYFLTNLWAQSKMKAMDGALKYAGYLMTFVMARYASSTPLGNRIVRNLLILMGVVVASVGYLTAAGYIEYLDAVQKGALLGSLQYPNALAAFAMFILFFLYHAWCEGFGKRWLDAGAGILYSACAFLLVGAIFLADSRLTLVLFVVFMALYLALLPKGNRAKVVARVAVSLASFGVVASRLDAALLKGDTGAFRQGLALGLTASVVLECARWLWEARPSRLVAAAADVSATSLEDMPAKRQFTRILTRAGIVVLVVAILGAGLIAAAKNPAGAKVLGRMLPRRAVTLLSLLKVTDPSILYRLAATKDALSIALDYPFGTGAGGWEALYHRYQRVPYWFTETHNHFAQMLVEIGFPGLLLYTALWGILTFAAIRGYIGLMSGCGEHTGRDRLTHLTSTAMAVFALGVHSAGDFDLSLPAIAISLFIAIGVLASSVGVTLPHVSGLRVFNSLSQGKPVTKKKERKKGTSEVAFPWELATTVLLAATLTITVAYKTGGLYKGVVLGSKGVHAAAVAKDKILAGQYLAEARKRDKWNPTYAMQMASLAADDYQTTGDKDAKSLVLLCIEAAKTADPRNLARQLLEARLYRQIGMLDEAVRAEYDSVLMMPTNREYHETLADLTREAIREHVGALIRDGITEAEREERLRYLSDCVDLVNSGLGMLKAKREQATGVYAILYDPKGLDTTPRISLAVGEIAFLTGDMKASAASLEAAAMNKDLAPEANAWLSYLAEATGYEPGFPAGFEPDLVETRKMAGLYGILGR